MQQSEDPQLKEGAGLLAAVLLLTTVHDNPASAEPRPEAVCQAIQRIGIHMRQCPRQMPEPATCCTAALGLPDRFAATYSLLCLHVWLLLVRLRREGDDGRELAQILYEAFQDDVEIRVHAEGVKVTGFLHSCAPELGLRLCECSQCECCCSDAVCGRK